VRRWRKPIDRAKEHSDATRAKLHGDGGMRLRLDWIFDCGDDYCVFYHCDDDVARRKIDDDLFRRGRVHFLSLGIDWTERENRSKSAAEHAMTHQKRTTREVDFAAKAHISTLPQVSVRRLKVATGSQAAIIREGGSSKIR
jgi:hypothetical protein